MEEDNSDRSVWLDYISKLNDRALNLQRASGFTTWAVAGIIAILLLKALAHLPDITTGLNAAVLHLTALTGVVDLLFFAGTLLRLLLSMGTVPSEVRLKSRIASASTPIVSTLMCAAFLAFGAANLATSIIAPACLQHGPFLVVGVFFVIIAFSKPASQVIFWIKHRKHFRDLKYILTPPFLINARSRISFYAVTIPITLVCLSVSAVPAIKSLPCITTPVHVNILIWSLYVAGVIFLSFFLCFRLAARGYDIFLRQLERQIILESLPPDVIRSKFVREFIGEDVRDWLAEAERELKRLHDQFDQAASRAEEQFVELAKIDRGMSFEITGRKKVICEALKKELDGYTGYTEKLQQQIEHLSDQSASVACPDLFKQVLTDWKRQIESIKSRQQAVCAVCAKSTSEPEKLELRSGSATRDGCPTLSAVVRGGKCD